MMHFASRRIGNATGAPAWDRGNFNFDAIVDSTDAITLARNYGSPPTGGVAPAIRFPIDRPRCNQRRVVNHNPRQDLTIRFFPNPPRRSTRAALIQKPQTKQKTQLTSIKSASSPKYCPTPQSPRAAPDSQCAAIRIG